jgi:hypothetical protein
MRAIAHALADRGDDLYETPEVAVEALLKVETLSPVEACQRLHVGQPVRRSPQWSTSTRG